MQFLGDCAAIPLDLEMRCSLQSYQIWTQDTIHNLRSGNEPGALGTVLTAGQPCRICGPVTP